MLRDRTVADLPQVVYDWHMKPAEYGEWGTKGATLSDVTAEKEFGISRAFIIKGINEGKLEYREGSIWGNPYLRLLRRQVEQYVADELGNDDLSRKKAKTELRKIKQEITSLKKQLKTLELRKVEVEKSLES